MQDLTVLVVDDDKEICDSIGIYLKNEGLNVLTVSYTHLDVYKRQVQDPESDATSTGQKYPQARTYTFGVNVSF